MRVFIVHGWEGRPDGGWRPWLKGELETRGFDVFVPAMPRADRPVMGEWVKHLGKTVKTPGRDCYFVGHSLGCIAILRYFESLGRSQEVGGAVLVAGFSDDLGYKELEGFFTKPIDWEKIRARCRKFVAINSDKDPHVPLEHGYALKEKLGAELIVKKGMGHFSGEEGVVELPVVLKAVLGMASY